MLTDEHLLSVPDGEDISEYSQASFVEFFRANPETRVVLFIRPASLMIKSRYAQYVKQGGNITFGQWLERYAGEESYLRYNDFRYACHLTKIKIFFDLENVLLVNAQFLKEHPARALERISKFGNLSVTLTDRRVRKNVSPSTSALNLLRGLNAVFVMEKRRIGRRVVTRYGPFGATIFHVSRRLVITVDLLIQRLFIWSRTMEGPSDLPDRVKAAFARDTELLEDFTIGKANEYLQQISE